MQSIREHGEPVFPALIEPQMAAAMAAVDDPAALDGIRRLSVLVEVSDIVTQALSLDHQLPRLIALIAEALDAERGTLFLHDAERGELFSRVAQGEGVTEIRIPQDLGIAGAVFGSGRAEIVDDVYRDPRFNQNVDRRTGYRTRSLLCAPLRNAAGAVIGVTQALNKRSGAFSDSDLALVEAINRHAAAALEQARLMEWIERARREEAELLSITEAIASELHLDNLLGRIVRGASALLDAERATLFLYDPGTEELYSRVAEGVAENEIRVPADAGIVGAAFASGRIVEVPHAYADKRFNRAIDRATGFHTRNLVAAPVIDRGGERLGVLQVLNKRAGAFTPDDLRRLRAFSADIAIALHNARLFSDVLTLKNYNESILKSLSNGVVTLDPHFVVVKVNEAAQRILGQPEDALVRRKADQVFGNRNGWVTASLAYIARINAVDYHADTDLVLADGAVAAVNLTAAPIRDAADKSIGYMLVLEDITREKRVRNTMARYVAKEVVDQLLAAGDDALEGSSLVATVLFSDIRRFALLSEAMTPRATVAMLNEFFTEMVEVIFKRGGMLDKYLGDGLMAIFGAPVMGAADARNALLVATEMMRALARLNSSRGERGLEPIEIGIGLATGEVMAGSVGSMKRMTYTVIGDHVNLAARLESANKYYGTSVLVAGSTVEALGSQSGLRRLDLIRAKGISRPSWIYESLEHHTTASFPRLVPTVAAYEAGLDCYRHRDWPGALSRFEEALELTPQDRPSRIFRDRCRHYQLSPPPEDWDGVWVMAQK
jgi:adenylate cyclase